MTDTLQGGPSRPPWRPRRRTSARLIGVTITAAVVATATIVVLARHQPSEGRRTASAPVEPTAAASICAPVEQRNRPLSPDLVAVALPAKGFALVASPPPTHRRQWSMIVIGPGGGLGRDEAVVTFPVGPPRTGRSTVVNGQPARVDRDRVTWRIDGQWATMHGYLSAPLSYLATFVRIRHGRPALSRGSALPVAATVPAQPTLVREIRYDARRLGGAGRALGGLVFTGVTRTAALDDEVVSGQPPLSGTVHGKPAVLTRLFGGNAALAWEPTPGAVAYVGYSGVEQSDRVVAALHCLADRSRAVSARQWRLLRSNGGAPPGA